MSPPITLLRKNIFIFTSKTLEGMKNLWRKKEYVSGAHLLLGKKNWASSPDYVVITTVGRVNIICRVRVSQNNKLFPAISSGSFHGHKIPRVPASCVVWHAQGSPAPFRLNERCNVIRYDETNITCLIAQPFSSGWGVFVQFAPTLPLAARLAAALAFFGAESGATIISSGFPPSSSMACLWRLEPQNKHFNIRDKPKEK